MNIKKLITDLQVCADGDIICTACERYHEMKEKGGTSECVNKLLRDAAAALEGLQAHNDALECERQTWLHDQERYRWIPVTERLLEDSRERVLVKLKEGNCTIGYSDMDTDRTFRGKWVRWGSLVTHWMPLPEPPKEVE